MMKVVSAKHLLVAIALAVLVLAGVARLSGDPAVRSGASVLLIGCDLAAIVIFVLRRDRLAGRPMTTAEFVLAVSMLSLATVIGLAPHFELQVLTALCTLGGALAYIIFIAATATSEFKSRREVADRTTSPDEVAGR